jgi:hypothetical protein
MDFVFPLNKIFTYLFVLFLGVSAHATKCTSLILVKSDAQNVSPKELRKQLDRVVLSNSDGKFPYLAESVKTLTAATKRLLQLNKRYYRDLDQEQIAEIKDSARKASQLLDSTKKKGYPFLQTLIAIHKSLAVIGEGYYEGLLTEPMTKSPMYQVLNRALKKNYYVLPTVSALSISDLNVLHSYGILPLGVTTISKVADGERMSPDIYFEHDAGHAFLVLNAPKAKYNPDDGIELRRLLAESAILSKRMDYSNNVLIVSTLREDSQSNTSLSGLISGKGVYDCRKFIDVNSYDDAAPFRLTQSDCEDSIKFLTKFFK